MSIITISRGSYSGGRTLAECVAKRLGYQCVSREANHNAAAVLYGIPAESLAAEEKAPSFWERLGGRTSQYLTFISAALCEPARAGNLIYHGYLGHLLLPGISHVLRVRVVADPEYRINAVMKQQKLARPDAIAYIERVDKERRDWVRFLFGVEWDDPALYHTVLNLSLMSMDTACDLMAHLAEQEQFKPTEASSKALEDLALSSRVSAEIARNPLTAQTDLKVSADGGLVTVTGTARAQEGVGAISLVVGQVDGVKEIRQHVKVRPPFYR